MLDFNWERRALSGRIGVYGLGNFSWQKLSFRSQLSLAQKQGDLFLDSTGGSHVTVFSFFLPNFVRGAS